MLIELEKMISQAHRKISRIKGIEYCPTVKEIEEVINKMIILKH